MSSDPKRLEVPDGCHSEEFVVMFLGYLHFKVGYPAGTMPNDVLEAWAEFKREMGKK